MYRTRRITRSIEHSTGLFTNWCKNFNKETVEFSSFSCYITADEQLAEKMYKITKEYANRCNLYKAVKMQWWKKERVQIAIMTVSHGKGRRFKSGVLTEPMSPWHPVKFRSGPPSFWPTNVSLVFPLSLLPFAEPPNSFRSCDVHFFEVTDVKEQPTRKISWHNGEKQFKHDIAQ